MKLPEGDSSILEKILATLPKESKPENYQQRKSKKKKFKSPKAQETPKKENTENSPKLEVSAQEMGKSLKKRRNRPGSRARRRLRGEIE